MSRDRAPHRLLPPLDHSAPASESLDVATLLARDVNGSVTLLAVAPLAPPQSGLDDLAGATGSGADPQEQEVLGRLAPERLDEIAADMRNGLDVSAKVGWGPAGPAIADEVEHGGHDLVVMPIGRQGELGHSSTTTRSATSCTTARCRSSWFRRPATPQ